MPVISGIASNLDTDRIIQELMALERRPIQLAERRKATFDARLKAVGDLRGNLAALRSSARMLDPDVFLGMKASSSDESIVTATASAGSEAGSHTVEVVRLATAHRVASQGFGDPDTTSVANGAGVFSFRVGTGEVKSFDVTARTTMRDLSRAINAAGAGVRASIVRDSSGTNAYRMVLTAEATGAANTIEVLTNDTTLNFTSKAIDTAEVVSGNSGTYTGTVTSSGTYTGTGNKTFFLEIIGAGRAGVATYRYSTDGGVTWDDNGGSGYTATVAAAAIGGNTEGVEIAFSDDGSTLSVGDRFQVDVFDPTLETPQDAVLTVDGLRMTSASNSVTTVIENVTLDLARAAPGTVVTIEVEPDTSTVFEKVNGLVTTYNAVMGFINGQNAYDPKDRVAKPLLGDPTMRGIEMSLRRIIGSAIPGIPDGQVNSLGGIGIKTGPSGLLTLDRKTFEEAFQADPVEVERLFLGMGTSDTSRIQFRSRTGATKSGTYTISIQGTGADRKVYAGGLLCQVDGDTVKGVAGTDLEGMVLEIPGLASLNEGIVGAVTITSGVAEQLDRYLDGIVDSAAGVLKGKQDGIQAAIKAVDERIERQNLRLEKVEARLRKQFVALEMMMGRMQSQSDYLARQIAAWSL